MGSSPDFLKQRLTWIILTSSVNTHHFVNENQSVNSIQYRQLMAVPSEAHKNSLIHAEGRTSNT